MRLPVAILMLSLATPVLANPVLSASARPVPHRPAPIFTAVELNNLARLDDATVPRVRLRAMQTEIAVLRDQVGRMKLTQLIDTVLDDDTRLRPRTTH